MRKNSFLIISLLSLFSFYCSFKAKKYNSTKGDYHREIFCGDSVVWQIFFSGGFNNDSITIFHENQPLCKLYGVSTGNNGCTGSYVSLFKRGNMLNLYWQCNSKLDSTLSIKPFWGDSLKLKLEIRGNLFPYDSNLKDGRFHLIGLDGNNGHFHQCIGCL
jgi:hypothetical protein